MKLGTFRVPGEYRYEACGRSKTGPKFSKTGPKISKIGPKYSKTGPKYSKTSIKQVLKPVKRPCEPYKQENTRLGPLNRRVFYYPRFSYSDLKTTVLSTAYA